MILLLAEVLLLLGTWLRGCGAAGGDGVDVGRGGGGGFLLAGLSEFVLQLVEVLVELVELVLNMVAVMSLEAEMRRRVVKLAAVGLLLMLLSGGGRRRQ